MKTALKAVGAVAGAAVLLFLAHMVLAMLSSIFILGVAAMAPVFALTTWATYKVQQVRIEKMREKIESLQIEARRYPAPIDVPFLSMDSPAQALQLPR